MLKLSFTSLQNNISQNEIGIQFLLSFTNFFTFTQNYPAILQNRITLNNIGVIVKLLNL